MIRNKNTVLIGYCTFLSVQNTELIYYIIGLDIKLCDREMVNYFHTFITFCIMLSISVVTMKLLCRKIKMKPSNIILLFLFSSAQYFFFSSRFLDSSSSPFLYSILPFSPLLSSHLNTVILYWSGEASCLSVTGVKEASYFLVYLFNIQSKPPGFPDFMKSNLVA